MTEPSPVDMTATLEQEHQVASRAKDGPTSAIRHRMMRRAAAGMLIVAMAASISGCGTSTSQTRAIVTSSGTRTSRPSGEQLFTSAGCASCHTLAAAHATGSVGPNLDQLKPSYATVARQVMHGGGGMPSFKGQLSKAEIAAVASYVAKAAH